MPAFFSPLQDTSTWTLSLAEETTIPTGLRYAGYKFRGVSATRATAANVLFPALSVLRKVVDSAGPAFVELQVNPFPIRQLIAALPLGVPTFYLVFSDSSGLVAFDDHETAIGDDVLATATSVTIICAGQDRVVLDPALWAQQITDAINAVGGNAAPWEPFALAVNAALNTGDTAPVLLLDHTGQPLTSGEVDITFGTTTHHAILAPEDHGDLQKTVARMHLDPTTMAIGNLWGSGSTFDLRPFPSLPPEAIQLARFEDGLTASASIAVSPLQRHITFTNLFDWFAEQNAIPLTATSSPLARFSRNNRVSPLVNGPEFFDDLFRRLQAARVPTGGFHLTGWSMFPEAELTKRLASDPSDLPITLQEAAQLIGAAGGACRFLPTQLIQLEPNDTILPLEALLFFLGVAGILSLNALGVSFARTDGAGAVLLLAGWLGSIIFTSYILDEHGRPLEQNKSAFDILGTGITNSLAHFSPYPADVVDNPNATLGSFPFTTLFTVMRHFGCYHQKLAIVRTGSTDFLGYCGGIDLNPDRLDTAAHLNKQPFHDVHARVEGPAVHDLALSFEQRWRRDSPGDALAFTTPNAADLGSPGSDIVQVARTYFSSHGAGASSRALSFAPNGDRTIVNTLVSAIAAAREFIYIEDQYFTPPQAYHDALVQQVSDGAIRKLIIVIPGVTDQIFGEIARSQVITDLRTADAGRGIVQVGYMRRHYTLAENEVRASSGRCILGENMSNSAGVNPTIVLGPKERVPAPPFWVAVDGELMWVYDVATDPPPDSTTARFKVDRGSATRLVAAGSSPAGARMREHKARTAATVVELSGIYVHAKMMIVDDVFLGVGSANLNERGLTHDGEINIFTIPQSLKTAVNNPIAALRKKLWAEMLNLPAEMSAPLLRDPQAAARLFQRSAFAGNRFVDIDTFPTHTMLGDGSILGLVGVSLAAPEHIQLFNTVIDPTS